MLISVWFLTCVLLLVQNAICDTLQHNPQSDNEKSSKQFPTEMETYEYNHPPVPELNKQRGARTQKSVINSDENPSSHGSTRSRTIRRRVRPKASTPTLEIPVQVIYDPEPTTVRSLISTKTSTISPLRKTTTKPIRGRRVQSNTNKKIDIRQTTIETNNVNMTKVTEKVQLSTDKEKNYVSPTTEFPKRSRGSYFKKRTETPAPRVKIVEEKNFVFAHSGNFHYSFLGGDGTKVSSEGLLRSYDNNKTGEAVSGNVYYKDNDGNDYNLSYTADENGYRPIGAHLPTPPPIPPAIARALKYIADKSTSSPLDVKNE